MRDDGWAEDRSGPGLRAHLRARLAAPVFAAPMFLVSGPELVIAASRAGVLSAFPAANARTSEALDRWLAEIAARAEGAPWGVNLILHRSNARREADLAAAVRVRAPLVVASVGAPDPVIGPVQDAGGIVFADVATLRHARKAAAAGADGLVLLTAGAGGNTGWLNPFAFVAEVRRFFDGPIAVAGGIATGRALAAVEALDADLGYVGTPFIAAEESLAPEAHKRAVVETDADGVMLTDAVTGIPANFQRENLRELGVIDAEGRVTERGALDINSWKQAWSLGQGCGAVEAVRPAAEVVARLAAEWRAAKG